MSRCILQRDGASLRHRKRAAGPAPLLQALAPFREDVVVCVAWISTWYWLADLGAHAGRPFGLGHALSMQALHGGTATNDRSDAQKIAVWLRGGMLPQAEGSPAERRAPRDLRRHRLQRTRKRAERLAPIPPPNRPYQLPEMGQKRAAPRGAPAPAVPQSLEGALGLLGDDAQVRNDLE
jgi:hypothetical protein